MISGVTSTINSVSLGVTFRRPSSLSNQVQSDCVPRFVESSSSRPAMASVWPTRRSTSVCHGPLGQPRHAANRRAHVELAELRR